MTGNSATPRFRFSLRTLLLVFTAFAVWFGWELHVSRERHRVRDWVESHGGSFYHLDRCRNSLFDDWLIGQIQIPEHFTEEDVAEVKKVFKEAPILRITVQRK